MNTLSILNTKRIVIKIGSSLLFSNNKFNSKWLDSLIEDVLFLRKKNIDIDDKSLEKYAQTIFENTFKIKNKIRFIKSHRWLYAQTNISYNSLSKKYWINSKDNKIFLTGDWVIGKSLSDAWSAGEKLSHYIKILSV